MKTLTGAAGLAAVALASTPASAGPAVPNGLPDQVKEQTLVESAASPYGRYQYRPYWRDRYLMRRQMMQNRGLASGEPFVKDAHPKGPSWVNSPRGIDRYNPNVLTNPQINVTRSYRRNIGQ